MPAVLVIADDLTGANATGVLFARRGLRTVTFAAGSGRTCPGKGADVTVVTTGSRRLLAEAAADRIRNVLSTALDHDAELLVKRVDTTLRGPIGPELAVLLDHRRARRRGRVAALAVPAYPAAGRTTVGGIHLLHGTPLARSPAGNDPVTPVTTSRVTELLVAGSSLTATELPLDVLNGDARAVGEALAAALQSADVVAADAATDADLAHLAVAAASVRPRMGDIVVVDSGPFGAAYCDALGITVRAPGNPVLVVIGSPAETTRIQLEAAKGGPGTRISKFSLHLRPEEAAAHAIGAIDSGAAAVGWHVPPPGAHTDPAWADRVPSLLAGAARQVVAARQVAGVFACGGDVAAALLDALQAQGIDITAEVQPLVVAGRVIGGPFDRLPVVTKGGLAGDENAITDSIGHLHSMRHAMLGTTQAPEVLRS